MSNEIVVSRRHVVKALEDLECLVVSLDKIGSAGLSDRRTADELLNLVVEFDAFKKLAYLRRILSQAYDISATPQQSAHLDRRVAAVTIWKPKPKLKLKLKLKQ